jgi:thermitase
MHRLLRAALLAGALSLFAAAGAQAAYDPHTVIVKFKPGVASAVEQAVGKAAGVTAFGYTIHGLGAQVAQVAADPAVVAAALNRSSLVEYAEVNQILHTTAIPNDPRFGELYGFINDPSFGFGRVNLAKAATA